MTWLQFIEFIKDKDCKVSSPGDTLKIECDGVTFNVGIDMEEVDLKVTQVWP